MVRSIGTAAVCEVTGDGELKSIFQALRPPFSFTPSLHLSLYVNHSFLSEAPSRAIFKHIELCTFSLFPSLHSSPDLASPPSPFSQLITFHSLFLLLISPFQPFASFFQPLFAFSLRLSSRLPFSLALCNCRWSLVRQWMAEQVFSKWAFEHSPHHHCSTPEGGGGGG